MRHLQLIFANNILDLSTVVVDCLCQSLVTLRLTCASPLFQFGE